jgi:hypothetical protein
MGQILIKTRKTIPWSDSQPSARSTQNNKEKPVTQEGIETETPILEKYKTVELKANDISIHCWYYFMATLLPAKLMKTGRIDSKRM